MANLTKQYLDYDGLVVFLDNLKEYIANRISEINGSNVNAYDKDEDNPLHTTDPNANGYKTIAEQLQALWGAIGIDDGDLSITEKIENIIDEYVKAINIPATQTLPLKLNIVEGSGDNKDRFTISLVDNGLVGRLTDVEDTQSDLASQIQALSLGMKVAGSTDPSTFFKGNSHSVTVTATVQNMPSGFSIEEIKIGNTNAAISSNKGTITESVKLSGATNSKNWNISARVSGVPFTASTSVNARYPIFYGMDENNNGLPKSLPTTIDYSKMNIGVYDSNSSITGCKLKRDKYRTSARGYSYEKISNSTATPMNFFVLVPFDVSQPTGFTMGGAPFVMDAVKTSTYTIDGVGVTYYIYKSGGTYLNGGSVTLGVS